MDRAFSRWTPLLLALLATSARAAFQTPFHSARTAVLGGAALAAGPEPFGLFVNPAGLAKLERPELYLTYTKLDAGMGAADGMGVGAMAVAAPTRLGTLGAGLGQFAAPGLAQERTLALGFAREAGDSVRLGVSLKHLQHSFATDGDERAARDPVFANGNSRSAFGVDLGVVAKPADDLRLAAAARNVNRPDVGLDSEDRVPLELDGGAALAFPGRGLTLILDGAWRQGAVEDPIALVPRVGVEKAAADDRVLLRLALSSLELSAGVGLQFGRVGLDYAFFLQRRLAADGYGSHRVGLSWRFGASRVDERLRDDADAYRPFRNTLIRRGRARAPEPSSGGAYIQ